MVVQTVPSLRYTDLDALEKVLEKIFAGQVWSVTWRRGKVIIEAPRTLREEEIAQVTNRSGEDDEGGT